MADTLLSVVQRVLRITGQNPSVTAFSDNDETQYIVDMINDALIELQALTSTHTDNNATITITAGTRLYSAASNLDVYDIDVDSYRIDNRPIPLLTLEAIQSRDQKYDSTTGEQVQYVYYENGQLGVYPILAAGQSDVTLKYRHPDVFTRLTAATDTFPYPDPYWVTFCEKYAQFQYEVHKGLGNPTVTQSVMDRAWQHCAGRAASSNNLHFRPYRRYGR